MIDARIVHISIQRHVTSGTVVNIVTAHDDKDWKIGEKKFYQDKALTDDEARYAVNAVANTIVGRESLAPPVAGKW